MNSLFCPSLSRRRFVLGTSLIGLSGSMHASGSDQESPVMKSSPELSGNTFDLSVGYQPVNFTGRNRIATTVNGCFPAPTLRWREGETVTINVTNHLAVDTSIHWHGLILPTHMDGVPGLSFEGIKPGETFTYQFEVQQSGTYWYHSHSGFQEATGHFGAIIIDPKEPDPVVADREYVVQLSDWSDTSPRDIYATLKKQSHYYNTRERTLADLWREVKHKGVQATWRDRAMWNQMRMSDRDIADVTGYTYTYLMNGVAPANGWQGLFNKGEKVRLRFINSAAMTIFDVRIPGLKMTVVDSDGQAVEPVTVDEFRIGVAETYDVLVTPDSDSAYALFAQSIDRSGYTWGALTSDPTIQPLIPDMDHAPTLGHRDMGMQHHGHHNQGHDNQGHHNQEHSNQDHGGEHSAHGKSGIVDHHSHHHGSHQALGKAGFGSNAPIITPDSAQGPQVDMLADSPSSGLDDPGIGLRHHHHRYGRRVLTYADLRNLTPTLDTREPSREIQLHLTGNMHRYMWSIDGIKFRDADPLILRHNERVRLLLVNDTMMTHPVHLHGLWSELETGEPGYIPRKHTVLVQPGSTISYLVTADSLGRWAYHCHLMFHMPGMFREVRVI